MVIVDNGVGFDENNKGRQDSYGLIGMKERIFLLEGNLDITSKVGKGTSVRIEIPYISDTVSTQRKNKHDVVLSDSLTSG